MASPLIYGIPLKNSFIYHNHYITIQYICLYPTLHMYAKEEAFETEDETTMDKLMLSLDNSAI